MSPPAPTTPRYHKKEILALCEGCPSRELKGCILADIEASRDEYLPIPPCFKNQTILTQGKWEPPATKTGTPNEETGTPQEPNQRKTAVSDGCSDSFIGMKENGTHCSGKTGTPLYVDLPTGRLKLKEIDLQILNLLAEKCHQRKIAKELNTPLTTINRRINRLEKAGLITPYEGVYNTKIYHISSKCPVFSHTPEQTFIHNEGTAPPTVFTTHSMSFKFPILSGDQPKSSRAFKTKSWTGYVFKFSDYTIRSTPASIIIDVNMSLSADSIDNLVLNYSQFAESKTYKFADKHHIVLGGISKNRDGHFTIEDNALAQIVTERGEFQTTSGLMFNKSQSRGDLEGNEQQARAIEYTINKLPELAAGIKSNTDTIQTRLTQISTEIDDIQKWLVLERENRQLAKQNRVLEESLDRITKEVEIIKEQMPRPPHTNNHVNPHGDIYG